jgi:PD-(D/E)XK endonuclease
MTKLMCEHRNRVGEIGELAFALHASQRDWIVSRPISERQHYDYIVDNGRDRSRIQVKTTEILTDRNNYRVSLGHGGRSKVAYTKAEIDFFAMYILPEDTWYILPVEEAAGRMNLVIPRFAKVRGTVFEKYLENWAPMERDVQITEPCPGSAQCARKRHVRRKPTLDLQAFAEDFDGTVFTKWSCSKRSPCSPTRVYEKCQYRGYPSESWSAKKALPC